MGMFRNSRYKRKIDEENPYFLSFSDIMSGLLIIFILATLYLMIELQEKIDFIDRSVVELAKANKVRSNILKEMKDMLEKQGVQVEIVNNDSILRVPTDQLHFKQGRYSVPESKLYILDLIGQSLYDSITKLNRIKYIDTIFIEGHTDSVPAKTLPMGNWGLSTFRAIFVWNYWRKNSVYGNSLNSLRNAKGEPIFSVSGYADTRRIDKEEKNKAGLKKNRRIDIRFTMRQPQYKTMLKLKKKMR